MSIYELTIEDVYDKNKKKVILLKDTDVFQAHKEGLKSVNAIREEITKIQRNGRTIFTYRSGFFEE